VACVLSQSIWSAAIKSPACLIESGPRTLFAAGQGGDALSRCWARLGAGGPSGSDAGLDLKPDQVALHVGRGGLRRGGHGHARGLPGGGVLQDVDATEAAATSFSAWARAPWSSTSAGRAATVMPSAENSARSRVMRVTSKPRAPKVRAMALPIPRAGTDDGKRGHVRVPAAIGPALRFARLGRHRPGLLLPGLRHG
jgi:hypothetical protein